MFYYSLFLAGMAIRLIQDRFEMPTMLVISGLLIGIYLMSYSSFSWSHQPVVSFALALERNFDYKPNRPAYFPAIGSIIFLYSAIQSRSVLKLLGLQPFQWLGKHSYSFYLLHFPISIVLSKILISEYGKSSLSMIACVLFTCFITFLLSIPFYRYVDRLFIFTSGWLAKRLARYFSQRRSLVALNTAD